MIKNIVFDIGGVLVKIRELSFFTDKGYDEETAKKLAAATYLSPVWKELDRGEWSIEQIVDGFAANDPALDKEIRHSMEDLGGFIEQFPYSKDWMRGMKERGFGVYCLSNISDKIMVECAGAVDFLPLADGAVLSYQELMIKPDPRLYNVLLERYSLKAEECIFIDDNQDNIQAARSLGFGGVVFGSFDQANAEIEAIIQERSQS